MPKCICKQCGKEFERYPERAKKAIYCSIKCFRIANSAIRTRAVCCKCGKTFYRKACTRNQKYCSSDCYWDSLKTGQLKSCILCGKKFYQRLSSTRRGHGLCCSKACATKHRIKMGIDKTSCFEKGRVAPIGREHPCWAGGNEATLKRSWDKKHVSPIRFKPISIEELNKLLGDDEV